MALVRLTCRRCGEEIVVDDDAPLPSAFPFCSERCRLVDLGRWFDEDFRLSRAVEEKDVETVD